MLEEVVAGSGAISLDETYFPVLIATWSGRANETTVRAFYDWSARVMRRARQEGARVVQISDAGQAERPDPVVRKLLAQLADAQSEEHEGVTIATIVVLESAVLRGAMTAIGWLTRRSLDVVSVADMPTAIRRARELLTKAGQIPPSHLDPGAYRRPSARPASAG